MCCVTTMNAQTGLEESWHEHFDIPVVHQAGLEGIRFDPHSVSIHKVPVHEVPSLDFYAKLAPADELYVSLQGAVTPGKMRYPSFWRVMSMRRRVPAFMAIADPTLQLSDDEMFGLAWYTGGPGWDPMPQLARIVRQAMDHVGASRVMFLGGSGGGFASLRLASFFPGSMAFAQDPQTAVIDYNPIHQDRLMRAAWGGREREDVIAEHPDRFDVRRVYRTQEPENFIYYRQSTGDRHLEQHCRPFMEAVADSPGMREGRFRFVIEDGEREGHGAITDAEFDRHFNAAQTFWRAELGVS
jgi:pimeloyl-ACP methyl ester carboxylesterase